MNITNQQEELKIINNITRINGYDEKFVDRIYQRQKSKAELQALTTLVPSVHNETKKRAAITFFPGITNKLQGIFKRHNIDLVYSNRGKLSDVLGNPKDKCHPLEKSGIYQIACKGCEAKYIGQTKRCTLTRFKEHARHIKYNHPDLSSVASHVLDHIHETNNEHTISIDSLSILKEVRKPSQLDAYESIFIQKCRRNQQILLNEDEGNIRSSLFNLVI
jgi:hypothetical protein